MREPEITTMKAAEKAVQELIDSFSDAIFLEACEEMISSAQIARDARKEETGEDD